MTGSARARRQKFMPLLASASAAAQLPGRHACTCQAARHALVANCLGCGRIVCEQEGAGPCLTCGRPVGPAPAGDGTDQARGAVERRDRLLERDGTGAPGSSRVIDDQADYFHTGSAWLSPQQRRALDQYQQRCHERRHTRGPAPPTLSLDLQQGVLEVQSAREEVLIDRSDVDLLLQSLRLADDETAARHQGNAEARRAQPSYVPGPAGTGPGRAVNRSGAPQTTCRVQDGELSRMSDLGVCLSVRQPWASLLVAGRQRYEGRTWYTGHRGRLWVAAALHEPSEDLLATWAGCGLSFPRGCLLGCVTVEDCLPQEEFRQLPDRYQPQQDRALQLECDSPYVLVCSDPHQLTVKFPVRGGHKLFRLDQQIHQAAKKMLAL